jgi:hypothetical protein
MNTSWDTKENHELVLTIFNQQHKPSLLLLRSLAKIALAGGFADTMNYGQWGCGSWLDQMVRGAIAQSERQEGISFIDVLAEEGRDASDEDWEKVVDSYLILPVGSYKSIAGPVVPDRATPPWRKAAERMHAAWKERGAKPPLHINHNIPLKDRFQSYLSQRSSWRSPASFFGVRPSEQDANALVTWILALEEPVRAEVVAGMHRNRHTWWRQFQRRMIEEQRS